MKKFDFDKVNQSIDKPTNKEEEYEEIQIIETEENEEQIWEGCLSRLSKYTEKAWICIPVIKYNKLKLIIKEVNNCSDDLFYTWILYIWPLIKESTSIEAKSFNSTEKKIEAISIIKNYHERMRIPKANL